jgi:hypothetical protein
MPTCTKNTNSKYRYAIQVVDKQLDAAEGGVINEEREVTSEDIHDGMMRGLKVFMLRIDRRRPLALECGHPPIVGSAKRRATSGAVSL